LYAKDYKGDICKGNLYYPEKGFAAATSASELMGFCLDDNACPAPSLTYKPPNEAGEELCRSQYPLLDGNCIVLATTTPNNYRCMIVEAPDGSMDASEAMLTEEQSGYAAQMGRSMSSVEEGLTPIMVVGGVGALVASLFYIWLLGHPSFTRVVVWGSVLGFFCTWLASAGICGCYAGYFGNCVCDDGCEKWEVGFWVTAVITLIFFCMVVCMFRQIQMACTILVEASKAVQDMKVMLLFPLIPWTFLMILYIWFCTVSAYLYGVESTIPQTFNTSLGGVAVEEDDVANMWWYHLFGLLWTQQLINAIAMMTVAGAVSYWYFTDDKTTLGHTPVSAAFVRTLRYHVGSGAFGALLVAIIQFIRCVVKYIENQCKGSENQIVKAVFCMIQSCLWCMEKCMKFLNKNAYIIVAMKGCMFCSAAFEAITLILTNPRRITAVSMVTVFVLNLGKLAVCMGCAMIGAAWLSEIETVTSLFLPCLVIVMLAYCTAYIVFGTYDKTVDTILLCVLEDEKLNKENGKYFANDDIRKFLAKPADDGKKTPEAASANEEDV
jgi:hypothetical protein